LIAAPEYGVYAATEHRFKFFDAVHVGKGGFVDPDKIRGEHLFQGTKPIFQLIMYPLRINGNYLPVEYGNRERRSNPSFPLWKDWAQPRFPGEKHPKDALPSAAFL